MTGRVISREDDERVGVTISEWEDRNRAVNGDVVAIALHPLEKWLSGTASFKQSLKEDSVS